MFIKSAELFCVPSITVYHHRLSYCPSNKHVETTATSSWWWCQLPNCAVGKWVMHIKNRHHYWVCSLATITTSLHVRQSVESWSASTAVVSMPTVICFSQILGGWPHECFHSGTEETPSVAALGCGQGTSRYMTTKNDNKILWLPVDWGSSWMQGSEG